MIQPVGTQPMETARLVLRRFALGDEKAMFENWANDEEVCRYLTWHPHGEIEKTRSLVERWVKEYQDPYCFRWGIVMKHTDTLIGSIDVVRLHPETGEGEMGYCISKAYWGKGITSEALHAVIVYLFTQAGLESISAAHHSENPASGKVMMRNGLRYVGQEPGKDKDGNPCVLQRYRILKTEFETI